MRATIVFALVCATAGVARAYPQFQLTTGSVRCNQCHYAPAGGGLINDWGREEAADTISAGGNGAFLHGAWDPPEWLALGGDFRLAGLLSNINDDTPIDAAGFPMQADLHARAEVGPISLSVTVGYGAVREGDVLDRLVSREHYLMWRPNPVGPYVRAGRFFAPYGLRLAEHPVYVRRWLGFNTLEETYNVSGGFVNDTWELHATAFTPDFFRPVGFRGSGGALYLERRFGETAALAVQGRVALDSGDLRAQGGLVGKLHIAGPKLLLMAQADVVRETFDGFDDASRWQLAAYGGVAWRFARGFMAQLMYERWDPHTELKGVARNAADVELQWFPIAHIEVSLFGRMAFIGGEDDGAASQLLLLQLHYYL
jgi:hypothetical protein